MIRVLHIETGRHVYGGGQQVCYLVHGLDQKGKVENLLLCSKNSEFASYAASMGIKTLEMPMLGDLDFLFFFRAMNAIRRCAPDIVHVHSRRGAEVWGGLAARVCGVKAVLTRRVDNPDHFLTSKFKHRLFEKVITISQGIAEVLARQGVPEHKVVCVHSAVQADDFTSECRKAWFRNEFDLDPEDQPVGMLAQFIARKGHHVLLKAIPEILARCPGARFLLFGRGPLQESIRQEVHEMGVDSAVTFAGFRHDLDRILPCLSLVVHPATMEGLGVSLLQAAASSRPIVATPVGGIPEIVRHGHNGLLVPVNDHHALAQAVIELLHEPHKAVRFGCHGRTIVEQEFSIQSMILGNLAVYGQVLEGRS